MTLPPPSLLIPPHSRHSPAHCAVVRQSDDRVGRWGIVKSEFSIFTLFLVSSSRVQLAEKYDSEDEEISSSVSKIQESSSSESEVSSEDSNQSDRRKSVLRKEFDSDHSDLHQEKVSFVLS